MNMPRATVQASLLVALLVSWISLSPLQAHAGEDTLQPTGTLTLHIENDLFYNTDRQYTHGTKISWVSPDMDEYRDNPLIERLPLVNQPGYQRSVSFALGQSIYTPEEIERSDLIRDDRPYAGITYLAIGFHGRDNRQMDTLEFDVGILGRHSYAEDIQEAVHDRIDSINPQGWEHQLRDEPILNAFLERKWRFFRKQYNRGLGSDVIPYIGGGVGNAFIGANAGGELRFGWNLPDDFGTYVIRPGSESNVPAGGIAQQPLRRTGVHLFLAATGTAVAHNILLDGNTFRNSHSVDKKHFVACFVGGIGIIAGRFKITYAHVYQTKEFKTQEKDQQYGAISVSYTF